MSQSDIFRFALKQALTECYTESQEHLLVRSPCCTTHFPRNAGSEYRAERAYERRGCQHSAKGRAERDAGYLCSSASQCIDQVLGACSLVSSASWCFSERALHKYFQAAVIAGLLVFNATLGLCPGGARPSDLGCSQMASRSRNASVRAMEPGRLCLPRNWSAGGLGEDLARRGGCGRCASGRWICLSIESDKHRRVSARGTRAEWIPLRRGIECSMLESNSRR